MRRPDRLDPDAAEGVRMTVAVPSELAFVDHTVDIVARHCLACGLSSKSVRFNLRVALAEALANAILYGNRQDPRKRVKISIRLVEDAVQVHVRDEGEGFDPACIPDPRSPDCLERPAGRGLFLMRELVDELVFNERGNSLCLTMHRA